MARARLETSGDMAAMIAAMIFNANCKQEQQIKDYTRLNPFRKRKAGKPMSLKEHRAAFEAATRR